MQVYDNIMGRPLSGEEIYNSLLKKTKIVRYSELHNYDNLNQLMKPFNNICLLYESKPSYGHWVCLILHKKDNIIEYFDPYGMFIDKPLDYVDNDYLIQSNQDFPYLSKLINDSNYKVIYNKSKLQSKNEDIATCGRHIISRITLSDIPLYKYQKIINKNNNPDENVTILTSGLDL
jgi:hypothetical protein